MAASHLRGRLIYVGLGSNLGNRLKNLREGVRRLSLIVEVLRASSVYETDPVGVPSRQPPFLNAVLECKGALGPEELVEEFKRIEAEIGRDLSSPPLSPRPIDLDLLLVEGLEGKFGEVELPHPRMFERAFVLVPLSELRPDLLGPKGRPISEMARILRGKQKVLWHAPPEALF
ncbi:MAG TPA: 2-amino-4-hydroxy-6-hydroxymethyldihydropteridine diphosphokinase [Armatimonadetes bacterium]|nr:2-amino-4-hydroxy-6-hydroxymethyldihydropteridine diphosphokinase [Armatimonadota bacterium]